jgi:hypothetical protein
LTERAFCEWSTFTALLFGEECIGHLNGDAIAKRFLECGITGARRDHGRKGWYAFCRA